ncbi:phage head spike fiber domain-containing protein [Enterobacter genomosp. S]|nr:hypothetical protein [Enterobacter genomosp. S]
MKGLIIPGSLVLGNMPDSGGGNDLSDIDLTSETLDPRLKFQCVSQHAYYASDGSIKFAAPDIWPLEYRDGVAVGRHEPEPQSTNYMLNTATPELLKTALSRGGTISARRLAQSGLPTAEYTFYTPSALSECYSLIGGQGGQGEGDSVYSVFVRTDQENKQIVMYADSAVEHPRYPITSSLTRLVLKKTATGAHGFSWLGLRSLADTLIASVSGYQVEKGTFVTSPIVTGATAATRAAAFVFIKNPGGIATSCRVHYSDGTTSTLDFAGAEEVQLAQAAADWGARYIQRIEYLKL